jgi:hypothetical protein
MTTKVSEHGLLIPKGLLQNVDEVEIRQENGVIVIIPTTAKDPIFELGQDPVMADVEDASINHDMYLHS